eukprot:TRINITY_DN9494_c0_g2_i1.p1 TRINITY_DN9494_c0_g2~~TRINITY_DN9494_c0_g2_i1.p1  ORF type:complete len:332 (-),score=54.15 TRINITY_DN9494_c0_g2_i1:993-1913(-)
MLRSLVGSEMCIRDSCGLGGCGMALICPNLLAPTVYHTECQDDFLETTIAGVRAAGAEWYQWTWVFLSSINLMLTAKLWDQLWRQDFSSKANTVVTLFQEVGLQLCLGPARAIQCWRERMHTDRSEARKDRRRFGFYLLHLPLFALGSMPSFFFVLSQNVEGQEWWQSLLGSSTFIACVKMAWSELLSPPLTERLARFKHNVSQLAHAGPIMALKVHKTQVTSSILFELVVVLLSPVVCVSLLDESCLRHYLYFAPDLSELMVRWDIGQQGFDAYRPGFCSRRLLSEFSYVWLVYARESPRGQGEG